MASVTIFKNGEELRQSTLRPGKSTIGRLESNAIALPDLSVSRRHAEVILGPGRRAVVRDLGASNHVYVNGSAVDERHLRDGDRIRVGIFELRFDAGAPAETRSASVEMVPESLPPSALVRREQDAVPLGERRLRFLYEMGSEIASTLDVEEMLGNLMDRVFSMVDAGRGLIALVEPEHGELEYREVRNVGGDGGSIRVSRGIVDCVLKEKTAVLVRDALTDAKFSARDSITQQSIHSALCVPLLGKQGLVGLVYLDNQIHQGAFNKDDLEFLSILCRQVALALESARLHESQLEMQRIVSELAVAQSIQEALLPKALPETAGWALHGLNVPSRAVGGDYYDGIALADGRVGVVIADVAGKGTPAALLMANAQAAFRSLAPETPEPAALVRKVNALLSPNLTDGRFITFFYGILNPEAETFRYCNAGHCYPYVLRRDGRVDRLEEGVGPGVGMLEAFDYEQSVADLRDAESLFLYTDGITEAANRAKDRFGRARLEALLRRTRGPAADRAAKVFETIEEFCAGTPQDDDITILSMVRRDRSDCGTVGP